MFFDIMPKSRREDLFNYEKELSSLIEGIKRNRIIVIKGVRRVGKTSLMRVTFNSINMPKTWIDGRDALMTPFSTLVEMGCAEMVEQINIAEKVRKRIKSLSIKGLNLSLNYEISLKRLNSLLRKYKKEGVIFIDEVQLVKHAGAFLSSVYDNYSNIKLVVSGSEVGILDKIIGSGDSPLAGRVVKLIEVKRLTKEKALSFLVQGFSQLNRSINFDELEDAVATFDGLIGWLTYYGYYRLEMSHEEAKKKVIELAKPILKSELLHFISSKKNKKAIMYALKAISLNYTKWTDIKSFIYSKGIKIGDSSLSSILRDLFNYGFVEKVEGRYLLADPLIKFTPIF